jgi:hypothetical protein
MRYLWVRERERVGHYLTITAMTGYVKKHFIKHAHTSRLHAASVKKEKC